MRKLLLLFLSFYSVLLFAGDKHEHNDHHYYSKDLTYLNLNHEQKEKIKEILSEYRKNLKDLRKTKREFQEKKQELFAKEIFDVEALKNLNANLNQKINVIEIPLLQKLHNVLTLEQRQKFIHYIDEWEVE